VPDATRSQDPSASPNSAPIDSAGQDKAAAQENTTPSALRSAKGPESDPGRCTNGPSGQRGALRWWLAVGVGCIVSLPFAWLLSYAASLPFFLGLFFFALFGVVIGAVAFRIAAPCRPYGVASLVVGTALIVAVGWTASMLKEARDTPGDMAIRARKRTRSLGDQTIREFEARVAADIRRVLRERYPPGGATGYVRWVMSGGRLEKGTIPKINHTLRAPQQGLTWATRVVLSFLLFLFGIASQTLPLRRATDPPVRAIDSDGQADST
jgi:hypothetical protein